MRFQSILRRLLPFVFIAQLGSALGCDAQCIQAIQAALAAEQSNWATLNINDDYFYNTTTKNISTAQPGDLLTWQTLSSEHVAANWSLVPAGMSLTRFLYMSEDIDRKPVPASAFVLLPYWQGTVRDPNATNFPTLVWTHGTAGRARQCAPSNLKDLAYGWYAPFFYASNGYAVIAPDYAGLGSIIPGGFLYEAGMLHAADAAYALVAARRAIGNILSDKFLVIGHSEGGMTAWRTNERLAIHDQAALLKEAGTLVGVVSASPALRPFDLISASIEKAGAGVLKGATNSIYVLQSLSFVYPDLVFDDFIHASIRDRVSLADRSCINGGIAIFSNLTTAEIYTNTSWLRSDQSLDYQNRYNGAGGQAVAAPMLVVQGLDDNRVYPENTEWDFNRTCSAFPDSSMELYLVPGVDHFPAFQAAQPYYMDWIRQRFEGVKLESGCTKITASPVNNDYIRGSGSQ